MTILAQTMGPESIQQFINPDEVIKRLAAASGIDVLNLVKSMQELQQERQAAMQQEQQMAQMQMVPDLLKTPAFDPSKNPALNEPANQETPGEPPLANEPPLN